MKSKLIALAVTGLMSALSVAAEPDTQVIEYYHPDLKHYFITASAGDAMFVDGGTAGGWVRTGRTFGAWSTREAAAANASMVYRFYSAGANSHVYVASDDDLRLLKGLEASEKASIAGTGKPFLGWGFEGEAFLAMMPTAGHCPTGTQGITRSYNHGFTSGEGSNHRYVSDDSLKTSMEDRQWSQEGVVFCAPVSTAAAGVFASTSSAATSGSYSGNVLFKFEETGKPEVKTRTALSLTLAASGAISGSGGGCTFAGALAAKNSSATLRGGSLTATGCTDSRFNGSYNRVEIEQFGASAIDVRFKLGDNAREAQIEGVLNGAGTTVGTPTTPTTPTTPPNVPSSSAAVAGDFAGLFAIVITERPSGQAEKVVLNVNQPVILKVSSTGVVTGSVQGCVINGTVVPGVDNRFAGSIAVTACSEVRLNGAYAIGVHLEDNGAIEAELEREVEQGGLRTKVRIEGNLARTSPSTNPTPTPTPTPTTPPASGIAIAGTFAGNADFLATRRPAGGRETTEVNKSQAVSFTIAGNGNVTGSGAGCSFSGSLAVSNAALGVFSGTVTAAGCTDGIINGSYTATATRQDSSGLELELERETEISGERVKVKIKGRLSK
ncbi:MAG: hypothetical protein ABL931_01230 [Usitatibacteraceae bacterium]